MTPSLALVVWLLGVSASLGALWRIGKEKPDTFGDSWTGDDLLDLTVAALWPVFWPCFAAYKLGTLLARLAAGLR